MSQATEQSTTIPTRRSMLVLAPATAVSAMALGAAGNMIAAALTPDPVFELIETHKAAVAAYTAALAADDELDDRAWERRNIETMNAELDVRVCLLTFRPTTIAGVTALLSHVGQPEWLGESKFDDETVLSGALAMDGDVKAAALMLPRILAAVLRSIDSGFLGDTLERP